MTQLCLLPRQGRLIIVTVMTLALTLQALEAVVAYLSRPIGRKTSASLCQSAFRLALINGACTMKDGFVEVPMGPGIGVEVDRAVIEKYEIAL